MLEVNGKLDHINKKIEELQHKTQASKEKVRPSQDRESTDVFVNYLVSHSNSKNVLNMQQAVAERSKRLVDKIVSKDVEELEALKSDELNQMFEGTKYKLGDLYKIKKAGGM